MEAQANPYKRQLRQISAGSKLEPEINVKSVKAVENANRKDKPIFFGEFNDYQEEK